MPYLLGFHLFIGPMGLLYPSFHFFPFSTPFAERSYDVRGGKDADGVGHVEVDGEAVLV